MTFDTRTMMPSNTTSGLGEDPMNVEFESVRTPLPSDILCGKNKICIKHEGSKSFRRIIESYTLKYQQASSRNKKMEVTKEIFDKLQTRRFLKYNEETEMWETLHPLAIRDKIGHALRFSNRKGSSAIRKQVRRSASDVSDFKKDDFAAPALIASQSLGSMDALQLQLQHEKSQSLLRQVQNANLEPNSIKMQPPLSNMSLKSSMHYGNVFTSVVKNTQPAHGVPIRDNDLSWMLQMPLLEMGSDGKIFLNEQQKKASV